AGIVVIGNYRFPPVFTLDQDVFFPRGDYQFFPVYPVFHQDSRLHLGMVPYGIYCLLYGLKISAAVLCHDKTLNDCLLLPSDIPDVLNGRRGGIRIYPDHRRTCQSGGFYIPIGRIKGTVINVDESRSEERRVGKECKSRRWAVATE